MQQAVYGKGKLNYLIYTPSEMSKDEKYPLILFLHGAGERGDDLEKVKRHGIAKIFDGNVNYKAIAVSPQCPEGKTWNSQTETLYELIQDIVAQYPIDENAITITGLSMGGFGTWQMIMDYPTLFSAASPICGGGMAWRAGTIVDLPIRIYHGEIDEAVDVFYSRDLYRALKEENAKDVSLFVYPNVGHGVWTEAYEQTDLIEWLLSKRK